MSHSSLLRETIVYKLSSYLINEGYNGFRYRITAIPPLTVVYRETHRRKKHSLKGIRYLLRQCWIVVGACTSCTPFTIKHKREG